MHRSPLDRFLPAALSIGVIFGSNVVVWSQESPGLSSGSGAGTGSGASTGVQRNQSGSMSGVGPGDSGFNRTDPGRFPLRPISPRYNVPAGPGVDVVFPDDPALVPFLRMDRSATDEDGKAPTQITQDVLKNARSIATPSERSLAFQLIAKGAVFSNQFSMAHDALEEAAASALQEPVPLMHDLRLIAIITTYSTLTDAVLREGQDDVLQIEPEPAKSPEPLPTRLSGKVAIRFARLQWNRAAYLAQRIHNPTNRSEMLFHIVESQAAGSNTIASEYTKGPDLPTDDRPAPKSNPEEFNKLAGEVLGDAVAVADTIERPVWKGKSLVRIAMGAADSLQYEQGFKVARSIEDPEYRTEALLFLAESQSRLADRLASEQKDRLNRDATQTYSDAARAVSEIRQMGLRGVCNGFLVDSLISVGRFDDARACVALYPEEYQRFVALGAIAESQGKRGSADAARNWIARETPEAYQPTLYRRVTRGVLSAIEQNRSQKNLESELGPQ